MKRIAAALLSVLLLAAASCGRQNAETLPEAENADEIIDQPVPLAAPETEEKFSGEADGPTDLQYVSMKTLELESKPYVQNGELILYFTNHDAA